ncbi:hypothetical protein ACQ4LE_011073 [Meloidogyne hapla]
MFSSTGSVKLVNIASGYKATILCLAFLLIVFIIITIEQKTEENSDDDITSNLEEKENIFVDDDDDISGGWNDFNNDELFYLLKENNCTIERVDGAKLSQEDFLTNYAYSKPLIITNVFDNARKSYFLKSNLLRDWGDSPVVLASANTYRFLKLLLVFIYKNI